MVTDTKQNTYEISNCYKTLYDASETLFLEIWKERKRYDRARLTERTLSVGGGALGGALGGAAIASAVFKAGTAAMTFGMTGLVIIGVIVGAVVVTKIASNLYDPRNADRMEEAVQKSIAQFKEEVNRTRTQMIEQVSAQMKEILQMNWQLRTGISRSSACLSTLRSGIFRCLRQIWSKSMICCVQSNKSEGEDDNGK